MFQWFKYGQKEISAVKQLDVGQKYLEGYEKQSIETCSSFWQRMKCSAIKRKNT